MVKLFMHNVFKYHGMAQSIASDRDPRMTSLFWKALSENMGTTVKFSFLFHSQTDGQSEEASSTVLDLLKCYVLEHKATREHYLPLVNYAYNNTVHTSVFNRQEDMVLEEVPEVEDLDVAHKDRKVRGKVARRYLDLESAHELIDKAISTALRESKPVYINVSCNLAGLPHPTFSREPVPYAISPRLSNCQSLEAAVEMAAEFLNIAVKPVLVGGPKLRVSKAEEAFRQVADASGYAVSVMPSAKGLFPETHSQFIGTYWGAVSTPYCLEIVESADAYLFAGPVFNDYSSVGYSLLFNKAKAVLVEPERVSIGSGPAFGCVLMKDFLSALSKKLKRNTTAHDNFKRIYVPPGVPIKGAPGDPLRVNVLFSHIQKMLTSNSAVIPETGDSWFNCQKLQLPDGCGYEFQMQYGSIGWSVGALLGYAQAMPERRVIGCIGDGSFQVTAQDVSTMIGQGQKNIIFLINNAGYTIEVEIHDGPYNIIKNWDYTAVVDAFHYKQGNYWTTKVKTEEELRKAIASAQGEKKDCLCFIECIVHKDDTSKELLEWGSRVSAANSRPPNPQ
ncbi:hypothetical protein L7F22_001007 [Adiantum nelumboides]|nr:hypothetical protein [Adiantum nelumboides]